MLTPTARALLSLFSTEQFSFPNQHSDEKWHRQFMITMMNVAKDFVRMMIDS
jgi:hypothetical protein